MPPPRRKLQAVEEATRSPPLTLSPTQQISCIVRAEGNNLYSVHDSNGNRLLVELQARFRSFIWLKRGGYVLVDSDPTIFGQRQNKLDGEIMNVVREEKTWRKMSYWPTNFAKKRVGLADPAEGQSTAGQMPSSDEEDLEAEGSEGGIDHTSS